MNDKDRYELIRLLEVLKKSKRNKQHNNERNLSSAILLGYILGVTTILILDALFT